MGNYIKWGWVKLPIFGLLLCGVFSLIAEFLVYQKSADEIHSNIKDLKSSNTALVLGTSKYLKNGYLNPYFVNRMQAVAKLYKSGKVKYILVSGDNGRLGYDESTDMKNYLIELGVPSCKIYCDFAGFRTLDSVVRCKKVFGETDIIVVSQGFHNQRAITLAHYNGMKAQAFNAKDLSLKRGIFVQLRERLARVKLLLDLTFNVKPKFLGPKIEVGTAC